MFPVLLIIVNLSMVGIMWFGGHRVDSGAMPIGNLFAFISYVMQILFSVMMSVMVAAQVPRAAASSARIQDVLDVQPAIHDPVTAIAFPSPDGHKPGLVEFRDVEFRYPGAQDAILSHISFTARPGQTTAIVGSTGSGKSTLIGLIPRLNDVTDGWDPHRRGRHPEGRPGGSVETRRVRSSEGVSLLRNRREQPSLRQS